MSTREEPIEYVPKHKDGGAVGRLIKAFTVIGLFFAWWSYDRSQATDIGASDGEILFGFLAFVFLGIAVLVGFARWVKTGRVF